MAEPHFRAPSLPPGVDPNPEFTSGVPGFDDTFAGPNDKNYLDRKVKDMSRLRGTDVFYYVLKDQTERIDGFRPLTDSEKAQQQPELTIRRRGGNISLYGEPVIVRNRINANKREVIPDWNYADPVGVRALALEPVEEEEPDERGTIFVKTAKLHIGRIFMDELEIRPRPGDVVRLPPFLDSFYDINHVDRNDHRFGAFGFFTAYRLDLTRKTLFEPQRKLDGGT